MKVIIIINGLTHYYNSILNKLNNQAEIDVVVIVPDSISGNIGDAVYQTDKNLQFRVIRTKEISFWPFYSSFKGLAGVIYKEKPDIIVAADIYMGGFAMKPHLRLIVHLLGIKLIMLSIPFGLKSYSKALKACDAESEIWIGLPVLLRRVVGLLGLKKFLRRLYLEFRKHVFNLVDAHLNYVDDGVRIFGSYGVPKERIFITYNSPDTDQLKEVERNLPRNSFLLPECKIRLVHVGRLVQWKRVDMLIRAFARIRKLNLQAELLIIGGGPEDANLRKLANDLDIFDSVCFAGAIYDPILLARYLRESTIYVLAGMGGLSINDAMFYGLPVICSVCDGTEKKLVRNEYNGYFFEDGNEDDLLEKICVMVSNPDRCIEMGRNSRKIIDEEVNIHNVINGYLNAFNFVLESSSKQEGNKI